MRVSSPLAALWLLLALVAGVLLPRGVAAQEARTPAFWFGGTRLIFERAIPLDGDIAVATRDGGLGRFLARLGATIAYQPQQRYVVVTAADHRTITLTIGNAAYVAGGVGARAAFAPFVDGGDAIVPLYAIAHALYVEPVADGPDTVLQPQIGALEIRAEGRRTAVTIRGATALAYVKRSETPEHVELAFSGVSSTLTGTRRVGTQTVTVTAGGSARNPSTLIVLDAPRGSNHEFLVPASPFELGLAFGPLGSVALGMPTAAPPVTPPAVAVATAPAVLPSPAGPAASVADSGAVTAAAQRATVTGVTLQPQGEGLTIRVSVAGSAAYDWHRLADQRWYLDVKNAVLTDAGRDEHPPVLAVESVRIRQTGTADAPAVRIALTLRGEKRVDVAIAPDGFTIVASVDPPVASARIGSGQVGVGPLLGPVVAAATPAPPDDADLSAEAGSYPSVPPGPGARIIVIDPGHGGSDHGTEHNGLSEKAITLDVARRLRTLLAGQGWIVRMTRDADVDPVSPENLALMRGDGKPNPSDRAYLQTRCDVANNVGARMFISIHVNYSPNPGVNGSTFYWYKPEDRALAQAMERAVIPAAATTDAGARHENLYVIRHTTMPAVLIETGFISNPHDAALLGSAAFLQTMAQGIANGVRAFAGPPPVVPGVQVDQ